MNKPIVLAVIILIVLAGISIFLRGVTLRFGNIDPNVVATNSTSMASTTVSLAIAIASHAQFRAITNIGPNDVVVYLSFKATSTSFAAPTGYGLIKGQKVTMCDTGCDMPLWTGNVWQITSAGTSTLAISQL